jgi:adenomatosis polyposis coli protein
VDSGTAEGTAHVMVGSDGSWGDHSDKHDDSTSSKLLNKTSSVSEDVVTVLSRNDSLSSLSVDSFGSTEPTPSEQALLEQCISSGMPKSKSEGGCGKARIVVPVSTKKKSSGGVCKIPLAMGDRRQGDGERSGPVIPSVPLQKLELKPVARIHCGSRMGMVGAAASDIPCQNLQNDIHTCAYDIGQIPKNGVDPSAAPGPKEMAAGVDESIAAITSIQNLKDHPGNSCDLPENIRITEADSSGVSAVSLANEAVNTNMVLGTANCEQRLESIDCLCAQSKDCEKDDAFRKLTVPEENQDRLDMKLEVSKKASCVSCHSSRIDSPHEGTSDDNKSPFSSGESPSDFGSNEKVGECNRERKDRDAMLASLNRLTEEVVQQAQDVHVQKEKNKDCSIMKQSDTWNEDTSPNDVSFPSMSTSAPLVASFKSEDGAVTLPELVKEDDLINKISEEQQGSSLTDSHMIEVEADRLAVAVQAEGRNLPYPSAEEMEHSLTSMNSVDLDAIKPPSMMGSLVSLTTSLSGQLDSGEIGETREHHNSSSLPPHQPRNNGSRLECRHSRKKSLPAGMMVRRALGNSNHNGSIENLQDNTSVSSSCNSHLDNIKPPSAMEELIDIVDMENSMVSVASITSEVADNSTKEQSTSEQSPGNSDGIFELIKPAASVMAEVYAAAMSTSVRTSSASDCLDNINPPSAFNEVADLADPESTIEPGTETICSDTEMYTEEPGCAHSIEKLDEVDAPDLPSDASRKATPSDQYMSSSAESTPKKHRQLTPRQKRQLTKERYKTYTITAEEEISVKKSGDNTRVVPPQREMSVQVLESEACGCVRGPENLEHTEKEEEKEKGHNKVTPKQRRLEDRQRFQTRVLDKSPSLECRVSASAQDCTAETERNPCPEEYTESIHIDTANQKTSRIKTLKQKRAEAKERFQTHTLSEESKPQHNCSEDDNVGHIQTNHGAETFDLTCSNVGFVEALLRVGPDEIESLLEHDANIVITTINDSRRCNSESSELPSSDEMLLECETLSLISIESESDQNSSICRFGKRRGSDLVRESSVTEEPGMSNTEEAFIEEKVNEEVEADTEDRESVADSETSQEDGSDGGNNGDDLPKIRGPRIVKPEERFKQDESADSNCTDDGTPQNNSPKSIRGRRKALYSLPAVKKATVPPVAGKVQSSIPVMSGAASNVKPTKASVLRQAGRGTPQRYASKTPSSSTEGRIPRNTSPKSNRPGRRQLCNPNNASPPAKTSSSLSSRNTAVTHTPGKESDEHDVKDPRFKAPERQGTFTKDESNSVMPMMMPPPSPTKTRIPVPASVSTANIKSETKSKKTFGAIKQSHSVTSATSKIKIHKEKSAPTLIRSLGQSRFAKNCSNDISTSGKGSSTGNPKSLTKAATIPGRKGNTRSPPAPRVGYKRGSIGTQEGMKTSLSSQSLQSNDSGKTMLKQRTAQPQRSNSNSSLNSVASGGGSSNRRTTGTRKEVTSKIASLWKRVEESKSKQKAAKKDTRVWITATHVENGSDSNSVSNDIVSASRLVRSSTFEGLPSMSTNNDVVDQDTKIGTETAKRNKSKTEIIYSRRRGKCEITGSCGSDSFTRIVAHEESSNIQRQVAEVTGMVIVQPALKVLAASGLCLNKVRDDMPSQEVVVRRQHNGHENTGPDSETPKRLSRLGSFIRIDSPEEEVIGNRDSKNMSRTPASAIVQPFNYIPPTSTADSHIPTPVTSMAKRSESYLGGRNMEQVRCDQAEVIDEHVPEFNTVSMRVTTV